MQCFILSINPLNNRFSIVESGKDIKYKLHHFFKEVGDLNDVSLDDFILGYKRGINTILYLFKVVDINLEDDELFLEKVLESNNGISIDNTELIEKLETQELIKISEVVFRQYYKNFLDNIDIIPLTNSNPQKDFVPEKRAIPPLRINRYPSTYAKHRSKEEELVYYYLFFDKGSVNNKWLDNEILNTPTDSHHGFVSMRFLHHIGLNKHWKGIFKDITIENAIDELTDNNSDENCYTTLINILKRIQINCTNYGPFFRFDKGVNELYYGVPGSGKSHQINLDYAKDESCVERVLFHPEYTYSDFIGQILPKIDDNDRITYEFTPGPFTLILKKALRNPHKRFYLIIEELNRGNAPAIFGDIFQLLDRKTKTEEDAPEGTSEFFITNSHIANEIYFEKQLREYGTKIKIPSNLSIIASMNTSDQNVFTLDTAFQRRWDMKLIKNEFDDDCDFKGYEICGTGVSWEKFHEVINSAILDENKLKLSSEDKRLGTHFIKKDDLNDVEKFSQKVLKYLWDDAFKFSRDDIFDVGEYSLEGLIKQFENPKNGKRFSIFKNIKFEDEKSINDEENEERELVEEVSINDEENEERELVEENDSE